MTDDLNPKAFVGRQKLRPGLIPHHVRARLAVAMSEGARKYGDWNWRDKPISYSDYIDALHRHLIAVEGGQDDDPDSKLHHLIKIMSTCTVMLDAIEAGAMIDDRKPSVLTVDTVENWRATSATFAHDSAFWRDMADKEGDKPVMAGDPLATFTQVVCDLSADFHDLRPLQISVVDWLRLICPRAVVAHVPNGGKRSVAEAARFKRAGVLAGFPDLIMMAPGCRTLLIELKATKNGSLSPAQRELHEILRANGYIVSGCKSIDDVRSALVDAGIPTRESGAPRNAMSSDEKLGDYRPS